MEQEKNIKEKIKEWSQKPLEHYYLMWLIKRVIKGIFVPFLTLFHRKFLVRTFLWFVFSVGFSLIGTIINVIKFAVFNIPQIDKAPSSLGERILTSIYLDSKSGTFYTFSIVLAASILYPLFESFIKHEWHYTYLRVITIIVAILVLVFGGVFYSFSTISLPQIGNGVSRLCLDKCQLVFFLLAILVAAYSYGLGLMKEDDNHPELDDYADKDDREMKALAAKVSQQNNREEDVEI